MIKGLNHKCDASTWIFCSNFSAIIFCCTPLKVSEFMIALATIITIDGELAFTYTHKRVLSLEFDLFYTSKTEQS